MRTTFWDENTPLQESSDNGQVIARYEFAGSQATGLIHAEDGQQNLHTDALGSIVLTTDPAGAIHRETLFDPWGNPLTESGTPANRLGYTGHIMDAETGLIYMQARYYDPETGRFISMDPAEGKPDTPASYHRYLYAYGNPTVYIDPYGLYSWSEFGSDAWDLSKGAGKGAGNLIYETLAMAHDVIHVGYGATQALFSDEAYDFARLSSVGKAADQGMGTGAILYEGGKGMVMTPARLGAALGTGDLEKAGEESFNLAVLLAPGAKTIKASLTNVATGLAEEGAGAIGDAFAQAPAQTAAAVKEMVTAGTLSVQKTLETIRGGVAKTQETVSSPPETLVLTERALLEESPKGPGVQATPEAIKSARAPVEPSPVDGEMVTNAGTGAPLRLAGDVTRERILANIETTRTGNISSNFERFAAQEQGLAEVMAAKEARGMSLSTLRYTTAGESFVRYESANAAFSRMTPRGGVTPGTFAAPLSDGLIPLVNRASVYNLPSPKILRPNMFILKPPPGTLIIGPRPVVGGTGNEVIFPSGFKP
jgi:RHS repeat-associated protein